MDKLNNAISFKYETREEAAEREEKELLKQKDEEIQFKDE